MLMVPNIGLKIELFSPRFFSKKRLLQTSNKSKFELKSFKIFLDKFPKLDIKYTAFYRQKSKKWQNPIQWEHFMIF